MTPHELDERDIDGEPERRSLVPIERIGMVARANLLMLIRAARCDGVDHEAATRALQAVLGTLTPMAEMLDTIGEATGSPTSFDRTRLAAVRSTLLDAILTTQSLLELR